MRVRSKIDIWVSLLIWSTVVILAVSVIMVPQDMLWIAIATGLPIILFLLWIYFGTYYEFKDDYLYCKSGPFYEKIRYDRIKSVKLSRNMMSSMALSLDRIEVRQIGKGYVTGTTFISPDNREEFSKQLISKCNNLDNEYMTNHQ